MSRGGAALLVLCLALAAGLAFAGLEEATLLGDEAIYAEVVRRAVMSGEWLPLRMGGSPVTGATRVPRLFPLKPSIVLPAEMAAVAALGPRPLAYRLPAALSLLALVAAVWWIGVPYGRGVAALSCVLLLGAPRLLTSHGFREGVLDGPLVAAFAVTLALWWRPPVDLAARPWLHRAALAVAVAVTAAVKFPVGLAVPAIGWLGARLGVGGEPRGPGLLGAMTLGVAGALAWAGFAVLAVGGDVGMLVEAQRQEIVARALEPSPGEGLAGYRDALREDFGAWLLLPLAAAAVWRRPTPRRSLALASLAWALAVVVPFALARGRLHWYVYPAWPALALLGAAAVGDLADRLGGGGGRGAGRLRRFAPWFLAAGAAVAAMGDAWRAVRADREVLPVARLVAELRATGETIHLPRSTWRRSLDLWNVLALRDAPRVEWLEPEALPAGCAWVLSNEDAAVLATLGVTAPERRVELTPSTPPLAALRVCRGTVRSPDEILP